MLTPLRVIAVIAICGLAWLAWSSRQNLRRRIKRLLGFRVITTLLIPLVAALPPVIVAATDERKNYWPNVMWEPVRKFLQDHPAVATIALFWPAGVIILAFFGGWARKRFIDLDELTAKEYGLILRALDDVSGNKMSRFGTLAADAVSATATVNPAAIFQTITQPAVQIATLLNGIYLVFRLDAEAADPAHPGTISVTVAKLFKGEFVEFQAWVPQHQPPNSTREQLRNRESAIERAAALRKPVIIKNIGDELAKRGEKRFVRGAPGSSEEGSLIAYPVIHQPTNDVPYVVTIRSAYVGHFRPALRGRYAILLQPFLIRISIEHSLALLKEFHANYNR